jgi:hypothetical protein
VSPEVRSARLRDVENRQLMAVQRQERAAQAELRELSDQLQAFTEHEQVVIHQLQTHGYLRDRDPTRPAEDPVSAA